MASRSTDNDQVAQSSDGSKDSDEPCVLLLMEPGAKRTQVSETLTDEYQIETATNAKAVETEFDCCILDTTHFETIADRSETSRHQRREITRPFLLLIDAATSTTHDMWEYIDDVIEWPLSETRLRARVDNLIDRRLLATQLDDRERQLESTMADLETKERAMDEAPVGITITDPDETDNAVIYVNQQFERLTGYDRSEVTGRNCRFLQGEETDSETRAELRKAIDADRSISVDIRNYRKDGQKFWNDLDIAPVYDEDGNVTNYVGFQTDITDRKIREQRLEVLNRVLSHNLRNQMNVITGHIDLLREELDGITDHQSFQRIDRSAMKLLQLAEKIQQTEYILSGTGGKPGAISLHDRLKQITSGYNDRYPDVDFTLELRPETDCEIGIDGLVSALEEAIGNAAKHNDDPDPVVEIRTEREGQNWITIEIEDNGPGVPEHEIDAIREGETPLKHADRLGIWLIYWVINRAGGSLEIADADPRGTVLTLQLPVKTHKETRVDDV
ncbi:MAG: PAS domain-containing protein [Halobacteriales archaeon]